MKTRFGLYVPNLIIHIEPTKSSTWIWLTYLLQSWLPKDTRNEKFSNTCSHWASNYFLWKLIWKSYICVPFIASGIPSHRQTHPSFASHLFLSWDCVSCSGQAKHSVLRTISKMLEENHEIRNRLATFSQAKWVLMVQKGFRPPYSQYRQGFYTLEFILVNNLVFHMFMSQC